MADWDDINECDCADRVPADLAEDDEWECEKCGALWFGEPATPSDKEGGE